jgi:hypothetical protein
MIGENGPARKLDDVDIPDLRLGVLLKLARMPLRHCNLGGGMVCMYLCCPVSSCEALNDQIQAPLKCSSEPVASKII